MQPDDELCLCFHVTKRKVVNFLRVRRPAVASRLSECGGAGTGCGWCVPFLKKLHRQSLEVAADTATEPPRDDYAAARRAYLDAGKGTPPTG